MVNGCDADRGSRMGDEGKINMGREKSWGGGKGVGGGGGAWLSCVMELPCYLKWGIPYEGLD